MGGSNLPQDTPNYSFAPCFNISMRLWMRDAFSWYSYVCTCLWPLGMLMMLRNVVSFQHAGSSRSLKFTCICQKDGVRFSTSKDWLMSEAIVQASGSSLLAELQQLHVEPSSECSWHLYIAALQTMIVVDGFKSLLHTLKHTLAIHLQACYPVTHTVCVKKKKKITPIVPKSTWFVHS